MLTFHFAIVSDRIKANKLSHKARAKIACHFSSSDRNRFAVG